jgi:hypothetical protein
VLVQVVPQQRLVQRLAARFGTRVGVRVDQPGHQPALGGQLRGRDSVSCPLIGVGVQVDRLAIGQRIAADPKDAHRGAPIPVPVWLTASGRCMRQVSQPIARLPGPRQAQVSTA